MALKPILDSLDELDDQLKSLYIESDGKYRLDIEGGFKTLSEIDGLTSALGKEREANKLAQKELKRFEGIEPDKAKDALSKVANWDENQQKAAEKMQKEFDARLATITSERDAFKQEAEKARDTINNFTIDNALQHSKAFAKVEDPIYKDHLQQLVRRQLKIQDGNLIGYKTDGTQVFDSEGNPAKGDNLIEGIIKSVPDIDRYFAGSKSSGAGSQPNNNYVQKGNNPFAKEFWNLTEQAKLYQQDKALALSLAKSAGVTLP